MVAACRRPTPELERLGVRVVEGVELADDRGVARLADSLGTDPVDLLVCNAGVNASFAGGIDDVDVATMAHEYATNALGAVRTVKALLPNLDAGAKVVLVTTGTGTSAGAAPSPGHYGYRMSKAALNTFGFLLAHELEPRGVAVLILNPGPVDTELLRAVHDAGRTPFRPEDAGSPLEVARDLLARADELTLATSGSWLGRDGQPMNP